MSIIHERLRIARENADLKQTDVAKLTNINNKTLSGYENGVSNPDPDTIATLAQLYKVTTDYLLGLTNDYTNNIENDGLTETEKHILNNIKTSPELVNIFEVYKALPDKQKQAVLSLIMTLK